MARKAFLPPCRLQEGAKYALSGKPRSGRGGEQPEQQNGTAEAQ